MFYSRNNRSVSKKLRRLIRKAIMAKTLTTVNCRDGHWECTMRHDWGSLRTRGAIKHVWISVVLTLRWIVDETWYKRNPEWFVKVIDQYLKKDFMHKLQLYIVCASFNAFLIFMNINLYFCNFLFLQFLFIWNFTNK